MAASDERRKQAVRRRLARVRRRLDVEVWLETVGVTGWGFAAGMVAWHVFIHLSGVVVVPLLLGATTVATVGLARPRLHSEAAAAALVDRLAGAGGLLLTRLERPVDEWELSLNQRLAQVPLPAPVLTPLRRLVPIAVFLAVGLLLPRWELEKARPNAAAAARVAQVKTVVEAIQNIVPVDDTLKAELAQLEQRLAEGRFTGADWEAADALEKRLDAAALDADRALDTASALAEALAAAQSTDDAARDKEALEKALMELGLDGSGARANQPPSEKSGAGGSTAGASTSGGSGVEELRRALQAKRDQLAKASGSGKAGGATPSSGSTSSGHASRRSPGRAQGAGAAHGEAPPAELVFGAPAEVHPERLELKALPKGRGGETPHELMGLRAADPRQAEHGPGAPASGTLATGGATSGYDTRVELPRNRDLVQRYFDTR